MGTKLNFAAPSTSLLPTFPLFFLAKQHDRPTRGPQHYLASRIVLLLSSLKPVVASLLLTPVRQTTYLSDLNRGFEF